VRPVLAICFLVTGSAFADTVSYTGALASPEDTWETNVVLSGAGTLTLHTWSFGGGTNAAGTAIHSGGFDPFVGVFDSSGNLMQGTSDGLSNYSSFTGCPPAELVTIGSVPANCGDITMALPLAAGTYTVLLSDAEYIPNAFQTCADWNDCNNDTANWALDVTTPGSVTATPEPGSLAVCGLGLIAIMAAFKSKRRKTNETLQQ
jgi:hypothetical protein